MATSTFPSRDPALAPPIGWPLLSGPDADGGWAWPTLERSVADGLRVLLATRPGELLMHPSFGAGLQDFLHEPNTLAVRSRIRERIEAAVARFEPRAQLDRVDVREDEADPAAVRVDVHYRLRRTGEAQRIAVTLGLGG
jgi:phage baseplate assembly protein W